MISRLINLLCLVIVFSFIGCGDDDDSVSCSESFSFSAELQTEIQALTDAALVYGQNPNTENCLAWVAAARSYLEAVQGLEACADELGLQAEYNMSLQAAEVSVNEAEAEC